MSCQSNGTSAGIPESSGTGGIYQEKSYYGYVPPTFISGWMYVNESGQMCGPYIQHQLYEGLSTGFLPEELPVYPVVNGTLMNPVPLKFFKQYPDHVASGFAYLNTGNLTDTMAQNCLNPCPGDSLGHGQEDRIQHGATVSIGLDLQSAPEAVVNFKSYMPNEAFTDCVEANFITSSLLVVSSQICLSSVFLFI